MIKLTEAELKTLDEENAHRSEEERYYPGKLIAIEGIDGAGTTTQTAAVAARLTAKGIDTYQTAEPSGGPVGRMLRELLSGPPQPARLMAMLFCADREQHLAQEVIPKLRDGINVLCDRFTLSTLAYQTLNIEGSYTHSKRGKIPNMDEGSLKRLAGILIGTRLADLTVFIEIPREDTERRRQERSAKEFYETTDEQIRVEEFYRLIVESRLDAKYGISQNIVKVLGTKPIEDVTDRIEAAILNFLWNAASRRRGEGHLHMEAFLPQ